MLYEVRIGEDVYLGTPEEVVAFLMRAQGAPAGDAAAYMQAVAARVAERLGVDGVDASEETAFLDSLAEKGVLSVQTRAEPSRHRVPREEALGEGPVALGPGVEPGDVDF